MDKLNKCGEPVVSTSDENSIRGVSFTRRENADGVMGLSILVEVRSTFETFVPYEDGPMRAEFNALGVEGFIAEMTSYDVRTDIGNRGAEIAAEYEKHLERVLKGEP